VAYGDLLRALEHEVRDQCRAVEEEARLEAVRISEEGRRLSAAAREEALARAGAQAEAMREKARRRASQEGDRAALVEAHRLLADVLERSQRALAPRSTPALTCAMLEEVLADDDGGPLSLTCDPGHAGACRDWMARHRPDAASRTSLTERPGPCGGVVLAVGDALVVDDTLPARLARAWPALQIPVGRLLLGEGDA
jgi:vacuolar-type H+-ATPase subunit E/Vma4